MEEISISVEKGNIKFLLNHVVHSPIDMYSVHMFHINIFYLVYKAVLQLVKTSDKQFYTILFTSDKQF